MSVQGTVTFDLGVRGDANGESQVGTRHRAGCALRGSPVWLSLKKQRRFWAHLSISACTGHCAGDGTTAEQKSGAWPQGVYILAENTQIATNKPRNKNW